MEYTFLYYYYLHIYNINLFTQITDAQRSALAEPWLLEISVCSLARQPALKSKNHSASCCVW